MEPTTSFQVPSFYGKNTAKSTENCEVDDQVVCESLLASVMNATTPDPDLLLNVSLNTSYSEDYSVNMSNDQKGKNRKRKLIFECGNDDLNIKSVNANTNKGKKGQIKKIKLNSESEKGVLNVKSGNANIIELKGQKA